MKNNEDNWKKEIILIIATLFLNYLFLYYVQKKCIMIC